MGSSRLCVCAEFGNDVVGLWELASPSPPPLPTPTQPCSPRFFHKSTPKPKHFQKTHAAKRVSSPPSPVLEKPPMRFRAMASVACASMEMEP